jgi:hypothetical protein
MKDPTCLGDYTTDGLLLSFCPECGKMLPFLEYPEGDNTKKLSFGDKRKIGTVYAKKHNLDYKKVYTIVKSLSQCNDEETFIKNLEFDLKVAFDIY